MDRLLRVLQRDPDAESVTSGEGSITDSGHGPSEEGEAMRGIGQPQPPYIGHMDTQQVGM